MPTSDSSHGERIRHRKQRTQAIFRKLSLRSNGTYPAEQFPVNTENIRQDRRIGQKGYVMQTASGSKDESPCC